MYSVFLPTRHSGNWLGAHQKFDKIAYRLVLGSVDIHVFPSLENILHFEGYNGPDWLKIKSAGQNEPSHYYDPVEGKGPVLAEITNHYESLVSALSKRDKIRAAFEASWLAHAICDGLTPAHHYPYEQKMLGLRDTGLVTKTKDKLLIHGFNRRQTVKQTWRFLGTKGLLSTHMHFEAGVSAAVATASFYMALNTVVLDLARHHGPARFFKEQARMISELKLYERFYRTGWTIKLARQIRNVLAPSIAQTIAIIWLLAYEEAGFKLRND